MCAIFVSGKGSTCVPASKGLEWQEALISSCKVHMMDRASEME